MDIIQIKNSTSGSARFVVHFLEFNQPTFQKALNVAKQHFHARKYRGKDFGGGIVIESAGSNIKSIRHDIFQAISELPNFYYKNYSDEKSRKLMEKEIDLKSIDSDFIKQEYLCWQKDRLNDKLDEYVDMFDEHFQNLLTFKENEQIFLNDYLGKFVR